MGKWWNGIQGGNTGRLNHKLAPLHHWSLTVPPQEYFAIVLVGQSWLMKIHFGLNNRSGLIGNVSCTLSVPTKDWAPHLDPSRFWSTWLSFHYTPTREGVWLPTPMWSKSLQLFRIWEEECELNLLSSIKLQTNSTVVCTKYGTSIFIQKGPVH